MEYLYGKLKILEKSGAPLSEGERLDAASGPLLFWYHENRRILPWREEPEPYRVWISEIMLQQTRVEAVKPYFARFTEELPDIRALAECPEDRLLKLWEGLGYYNRARNLQAAAKKICEEYGGEMPADYEEILKLPGIGSYTAGAISSIAFGIPRPAVDGNVLRVVSRLLADREEIDRAAVKKRYEALIGEHMDQSCPGDYNQALIELGALVCIPGGKPLCGQCPLSSVCLAHAGELTGEIPARTAKKPRKIEEKTVFIIEQEDRIAIRQRSSRGLLASLYEFPNTEGKLSKEEIPAALSLCPEQIEEIERLTEAVHIFTHVEWHMAGYRVRVSGSEPLPYTMVKKEEVIGKYPLPKAFGAYTKILTEMKERERKER